MIIFATDDDGNVNAFFQMRFFLLVIQEYQQVYHFLGDIDSRLQQRHICNTRQDITLYPLF